jgi:putative transposase
LKFGFVAKHRGVWPVRWLCEALGVSRSGFHAWLARPPSARALADEALTARVRASFAATEPTAPGAFGAICLPMAPRAACITWNG